MRRDGNQRVNNIDKHTNTPLSTKEKQQSENPDDDSTQGTGLIRQDAVKQEQPDHETRQTSYYKPGRFKRITASLTSHRSREFLKNPMVWLEAAALVVLIFYTAYTGRLVTITNRTLSELTIQTASSEKAAKAAKRAADIAADTLSESIEQFRIDERAWIEFDPIKPIASYPPSQGFDAWAFKYELYPRNVGKTVARDVIARVGNVGSGGDTSPSSGGRGIQMFQDGLFKDQGTGKRVQLPLVLATVLAPNTATRAPIAMGGTEPKNGFNSYLTGRIDYSDVFNIPHWMKFCVVVVNTAGEVRNCECCNDEDNNAELPPKPKR
jgi:hypothetical protein